MDSMKEYQSLALNTEAPVGESVVTRLYKESTVRLLHGAIGLCTEAGELQDALKRHIFYGKPIDLVNVKEEIGDAFWYMAILADACGTDLGQIAEANIAKLRARFPDKFSEQAAIDRDLDNERSTLESSL